MAKYSEPIKSVAVGAFARKYGIDDSNNCVVRAFCNVTGMFFTEAYEMFKRAGRKDHEGTHSRVFGPIYKEHGLIPKAAFGTTQEAYGYQNTFKIPRLSGITLGNLLRSGVLNEGKFVVAVRGHVFAVIDGEIIDTGDNPSGKSVVCVFEYVKD